MGDGAVSDLERMRKSWPWIDWDEPLTIVVEGEVHFACRVCIATHGLAGHDALSLPMSKTAARAHIMEVHS